VEVATADAGGEGGGFAHGIWMPQEGPPQRGNEAGGGRRNRSRLGAASEDTAKAGEPAGCHLPSRGPTEGSLILGTWGWGIRLGYFLRLSFSRRER
jgi:hypothetical protein